MLVLLPGAGKPWDADRLLLQYAMRSMIACFFALWSMLVSTLWRNWEALKNESSGDGLCAKVQLKDAFKHAVRSVS